MAVTDDTPAALGPTAYLISHSNRLFYTRIENSRGDRNDIAWEGAMTNRILACKLQQRQVAKIVSCTFENDPQAARDTKPGGSLGAMPWPCCCCQERASSRYAGGRGIWRALRSC